MREGWLTAAWTCERWKGLTQWWDYVKAVAVHFPSRGPSCCCRCCPACCCSLVTYRNSPLVPFPLDFETTIDLVHTPNITSAWTRFSSGIVFQFNWLSLMLVKYALEYNYHHLPSTLFSGHNICRMWWTWSSRCNIVFNIQLNRLLAETFLTYLCWLVSGWKPPKAKH